MAPYTKAKASQLADGTIVDEVNVFINPAKMAAGEKFSLTTSINGGEGETSEYLSETLVNFWKDNEGGVAVSVGLARNSPLKSKLPVFIPYSINML